MTANREAGTHRGTQEKGDRDALLILALLHEIGYATSRQIARIVYGKVSESTRRMANRKISWLSERDFLLEKQDGVASERVVALNKRGADKVNELLPFGAKSGKDILRHAHDHRTRCNDVFAAVSWHEFDAEGLIYWSALSELWIQTNPESARSFGARSGYFFEGGATEKVADLLLCPEEKSERVWLEVENRYRSNSDLQRVTDWLMQMMRRDPFEVKEIWFVVTNNGGNTIKKRIREALLHENLTRSGRVDGRPVQVKDAALAAWEKCRFFKLNREMLELITY